MERKKQHHIFQKKGLINNIALYNELDVSLGVDNEISCGNLQSHIKGFVDNSVKTLQGDFQFIK